MVSLRETTSADLESLVKVQREGAVAGLGHIFAQATHPFPTERVLARWAAELLDPDVRAYVVLTDGDSAQIVGFATTRGPELFHFGTAKDTWGTGVAVDAHDLVLDRLRAAGETHAWLRVFEENQRARRFYEKLGWSSTGGLSHTSFAPHPVLVEYTLDLVDARR